MHETATRTAEHNRHRAEAEAAALRARAEQDARRLREQAEQEVDRLGSLRDGARSEIAQAPGGAAPRPTTPNVDVYVASVADPARSIVVPGVGYGAVSAYRALTPGRASATTARAPRRRRAGSAVPRSRWPPRSPWAAGSWGRSASRPPPPRRPRPVRPSFPPRCARPSSTSRR